MCKCITNLKFKIDRALKYFVLYVIRVPSQSSTLNQLRVDNVEFLLLFYFIQDYFVQYSSFL